MKINLLIISLLLFAFTSCTSDISENSTLETNAQIHVEYSYSNSETELIQLINNYRENIGLNSLLIENYISYKSEEHNNYMIAHNVINHNDFVSRSENIIKVLGAKTVSENLAFNYNSSEGVFKAWLNSSSHKEIIEGDFTHFGLSIRENISTGRKYYTTIFVKI